MLPLTKLPPPLRAQAPLHWTAASAAVLLHDTSPDFVIVAGAVDSVSAGGAAARLAALAEANIPDVLDVRAMVLINSGRHCFGHHHASSAPVTEDAPLSPAAECVAPPERRIPRPGALTRVAAFHRSLVDGLSRSAREAEVALQRAFARSLLPCCVVRVGRLVGHDDAALVRTSRAAVRLGLVGPCSEAVETWHHVANVAMTVVAACTMGSDATYGRVRAGAAARFHPPSPRPRVARLTPCCVRRPMRFPLPPPGVPRLQRGRRPGRSRPVCHGHGCRSGAAFRAVAPRLAPGVVAATRPPAGAPPARPRRCRGERVGLVRVLGDSPAGERRGGDRL